MSPPLRIGDGVDDSWYSKKLSSGKPISIMKHVAAPFILIVVLLGTWTCYKHVSVKATGRINKKSEDFIFEVTPRVTSPGQVALLRWSIKGATNVKIEAEPESRDDLVTIGIFGGDGTLEVTPTESTTYVITCTGSTTFSCASATIRVHVNSTRR